jgi:hypothetical protein
MGLDISGIKLGARTDEPEDDDHDLLSVYADSYFEGRLGGIEPGYYVVEDSEWFYGRSYGGYNAWRNQLAEFAGYPVKTSSESGRTSADVGAWSAESGPFWELINFSDCEGYIGGTVAVKLAKDFQDHAARVAGFVALDLKGREAFAKGYAEIQAAFEYAVKHNGVVQFS